MYVTYAGLARAAAVAAIVSGVLYVGIQFIHPEETLETVTTDAWAMVAWLTVAMALLALVGITGIYLRQVEPIWGPRAAGLCPVRCLLPSAHRLQFRGGGDLAADC
jgi:thiamine monophosphate synthase